MIKLVHFLECFQLKYWLDLAGCPPTRFRTFYSKFWSVSINIVSKRCFRKLVGFFFLFFFAAESMIYVLCWKVVTDPERYAEPKPQRK